MPHARGATYSSRWHELSERDRLANESAAAGLEDFTRSIDPLTVLRGLARGLDVTREPGPDATIPEMAGYYAQLPATLVGAGLVPSGRSLGSVFRRIESMARRKRQPSATPDLAGEGARAATETFARRFPGTDPEVMADVQPGEPLMRSLLASARGSMNKYLGTQLNPVSLPSDIANQRARIVAAEAKLQQMMEASPSRLAQPGSSISDEAIARMTKLSVDQVRRHRTETGYRSSVDPVTGAIQRDTLNPGPITARVLRQPAPEPPKPDLDPIRAAMARTSRQRRILELYEQDLPLVDIAKDPGVNMDPGNLRRRLDQMIARGKAARAKLAPPPGAEE